MLVELAGIALLAAAEAAGTSCNGSRLVELSLGCIELPCDYQVTRVALVIDQTGGRIESTRTGERIDWISSETPWWLTLPEGFKLEWRRPALIDWHLSWSALFEFNGKRSFMVTNRDLWLWAPADRPEVLDALKTLAAGYRYGLETSTCEEPLIKKP